MIDLEKSKTCAFQANYHLIWAVKYRRKVLHVFVSAKPKVCIPEMVRVFKCNSARVLFEEFSMIKLGLWGGRLWSDGYAVRTAGVVTSEKIEQYINRV